MKTILIIIPACACGIAFGLKTSGWIRFLFISLLALSLAGFAVPVIKTHLSEEGWKGVSDIDPYGWGAEAVYKYHTDPYGQKGWISFPFPTFPILWALSRGGGLPGPVWKVHFFYLNLALSFCSALFFIIPAAMPKKRRSLNLPLAAAFIVLFFFTEGTARTLSQGQVNLFVAFFLSLFYFFAVLSARSGFLNPWALTAAGICLALAVLIKPIIFPILIFFLFRCFLGFCQKKRPKKNPALSPECRILLSSALFTLLAVGATLLIPGGISLDHYTGFLTKGAAMGTHDFLRRPMNFSPTAVLIRTGLLPEAPGLISALILALLVALASLKTLSLSRPFTPVFLAPWFYVTLLWSPISWSHYACWCFGAFLILFDRIHRLPYGGKRLIYSTVLFLGFGLINVRACLFYLFGVLLLFSFSCLLRFDPEEGKAPRPDEKIASLDIFH